MQQFNAPPSSGQHFDDNRLLISAAGTPTLQLSQLQKAMQPHLQPQQSPQPSISESETLDNAITYHVDSFPSSTPKQTKKSLHKGISVLRELPAFSATGYTSNVAPARQLQTNAAAIGPEQYSPKFTAATSSQTSQLSNLGLLNSAGESDQQIFQSPGAKSVNSPYHLQTSVGQKQTIYQSMVPSTRVNSKPVQANTAIGIGAEYIQPSGQQYQYTLLNNPISQPLQQQQQQPVYEQQSTAGNIRSFPINQDDSSNGYVSSVKAFNYQLQQQPSGNPSLLSSMQQQQQLTKSQYEPEYEQDVQEAVQFLKLANVITGDYSSAASIYDQNGQPYQINMNTPTEDDSLIASSVQVSPYQSVAQQTPYINANVNIGDLGAAVAPSAVNNKNLQAYLLKKRNEYLQKSQLQNFATNTIDDDIASYGSDKNDQAAILGSNTFNTAENGEPIEEVSMTGTQMTKNQLQTMKRHQKPANNGDAKPHLPRAGVAITNSAITKRKTRNKQKFLITSDSSVPVKATGKKNKRISTKKTSTATSENTDSDDRSNIKSKLRKKLLTKLSSTSSKKTASTKAPANEEAADDNEKIKKTEKKIRKQKSKTAKKPAEPEPESTDPTEAGAKEDVMNEEQGEDAVLDAVNAPSSETSSEGPDEEATEDQGPDPNGPAVSPSAAREAVNEESNTELHETSPEELPKNAKISTAANVQDDDKTPSIPQTTNDLNALDELKNSEVLKKPINSSDVNPSATNQTNGSEEYIIDSEEDVPDNELFDLTPIEKLLEPEFTTHTPKVTEASLVTTLPPSAAAKQIPTETKAVAKEADMATPVKETDKASTAVPENTAKIVTVTPKDALMSVTVAAMTLSTESKPQNLSQSTKLNDQPLKSQPPLVQYTLNPIGQTVSPQSPQQFQISPDPSNHQVSMTSQQTTSQSESSSIASPSLKTSSKQSSATPVTQKSPTESKQDSEQVMATEHNLQNKMDSLDIRTTTEPPVPS